MTGCQYNIYHLKLIIICLKYVVNTVPGLLIKLSSALLKKQKQKKKTSTCRGPKLHGGLSTVTGNGGNRTTRTQYRPRRSRKLSLHFFFFRPSFHHVSPNVAFKRDHSPPSHVGSDRKNQNRGNSSEETEEEKKSSDVLGFRSNRHKFSVSVKQRNAQELNRSQLFFFFSGFDLFFTAHPVRGSAHA